MKTKQTAYHTNPNKIDQVLRDVYLSDKERNELFQEFIEDEKYKVKPRQKHAKKREGEEI